MVALLQIDELVGDLQQGERVGGNKRLFTGLPYYQRAAHARAIKRVGLVLVNDAKRVSAMQLAEGGAEGAQQVGLLLIVVGQQVGDHFGIGFGSKDVAEICELFTQGAVVFDDAVMDDGQAFRNMRVGVVLGRFAVGSPAGVGDAQMAVD